MATSTRLGILRLLRSGVEVDVKDGVDSLEQHLSTLIGEPLVVSLHVGPPRANRKPVLQLMTSKGHTVAYAKVGISPLTNCLVRQEGAALEQLGQTCLRTFNVPRVLHAGSWQGLELLILHPLASRAIRPPSASSLDMATRELGAAFPAEPCLLNASDYWIGLTSRLRALQSPLTAELQRLTAALVQICPDTPLMFGAWHGDWTPWNMAASPGGLMVWDWERFGTGVPLGMDTVHYALQSAVRRADQEPRQATRFVMRSASDLLHPIGVRPEVAPMVVGCYLLEIASRYLLDDQAKAGARLGDIRTWLLPTLEELTQQFAPDQALQ